APRMHVRIHLRLEETVSAAALAFGSIQRQVRVLEKLVGVRCIIGTKGDADTSANQQLVTVDVIGGADFLDDAQGQRCCSKRLVDVGLEDRKFVSAEARYGVLLPNAAAQTAGHLVEQAIADGMAQRVVDVLKAVEIEPKHRNRRARVAARQRRLEL